MWREAGSIALLCACLFGIVRGECPVLKSDCSPVCPLPAPTWRRHLAISPLFGLLSRRVARNLFRFVIVSDRFDRRRPIAACRCVLTRAAAGSWVLEAESLIECCAQRELAVSRSAECARFLC